jgi:hypothetical protein
MLMGWPRGWTSLETMDPIEFQKWLIGFGGRDGDREILQTMWKETGAEALRQATRGLSDIPEAQTLFLALCEYARQTDEAWLQLACPSSPEKQLRGMQIQREIASASHRPGQGEQPAREYTDALQVLSRFLAQYGPEAWQGDCWENAEPRTANNVSNRVDRLKALGNGQVPGVVREAWERLAS